MINRGLNKIKAIARQHLFCQVKKEPDAVHWGIIGLGYMAETFATAIDGNKSGIVAAVASRSADKAEKFAKKHGNCRSFGSYESMLKDKSLNLDIVYIATPESVHYENIMLCLQNGCNVLCEKPITASSDQFIELADLAKGKGLFLMEGMWMKCLPTFLKADEWISEGRIGRVDFIRADFYKRETKTRSSNVPDYKKKLGVIDDYGIYAISFITHFLGGSPDIVHFISRNASNGIDTDWQVAATRKNIKAVMNLSSDFKSLSKAEVLGESGFIEWESQFNRTNTIGLFDNNGILVEKFKAKYLFDGYEYEINEVQKCIRSGAKQSDLVPLSETLETLKLFDILKNGR